MPTQLAGRPIEAPRLQQRHIRKPAAVPLRRLEGRVRRRRRHKRHKRLLCSLVAHKLAGQIGQHIGQVLAVGIRSTDTVLGQSEVAVAGVAVQAEPLRPAGRHCIGRVPVEVFASVEGLVAAPLEVHGQRGRRLDAVAPVRRIAAAGE